MGWRTLLALLLLVSGLAVVLVWTDEQPDQQGAVSVSLLDGRRLRSAVRIEWQFAGEQPMEMRREPGGPFRLTHPLEDLFASDQLQNIANAYDSAMIGETPLEDTEENRRKTGLDVPRLTVDFEFEGGAAQKLSFGGEGPLGNDLFVLRDGVIYRGSLALMTVWHVGIDDLRERQVFRTPPPVATEVVVDRMRQDGSREEMRLVRGGSGWRLVEPIEARADAGLAASFVGNILALRIDVFVAGVLRLPERPADVQVTVRGGVQVETVQLWRDTQENLFGRLEDRKVSFICTNQQHQRIFTETAEALRSRILVPMQDIYHEIATIMVEPGGGAPRLLLQRANSDVPWQLQEPITGSVEPRSVNELITAINNLRVLTFVAPGTKPEDCGLGSGGLRLGTQAVHEARPSFLRIGDEGFQAGQEITYVARVDAPDEIFAVPRGPATIIRRPWTAYVPREIFSIRNAVSRLDLRRPDGTRRRLERDADGVWIDVAGAPVEDMLIADIVDELRDLQGSEVRRFDAAEMGPPDWSLVLGRNNDPPDDLGFGALEVWDRPDEQLLVRSRSGITDVIYLLSPLRTRELRRLWQ